MSMYIPLDARDTCHVKFDRHRNALFSSSHSAASAGLVELMFGSVRSAPDGKRGRAELQALACRRGRSRGGCTPSGKAWRPIRDPGRLGLVPRVEICLPAAIHARFEKSVI